MAVGQVRADLALQSLIQIQWEWAQQNKAGLPPNKDTTYFPPKISISAMSSVWYVPSSHIFSLECPVTLQVSS